MTIIQGSPNLLPVGSVSSENDNGLVLQNNATAFNGAYTGSNIEDLLVSDFDQVDISNVMTWDEFDNRREPATALATSLIPKPIIVQDANQESEISMEEFMTKYQGKLQNNNNEVFSQQNWVWGMREHNNTDGVKENDDS